MLINENSATGKIGRTNSQIIHRRRSEFSEQMDVDKDAKVSMEELIQYLDPRHKQHAVKEADYLMSVADSDHDGELSEKEMITNYKLFTGSSMHG